VIQKLAPSLQTPLAGSDNVPSGVRSAAFQSETPAAVVMRTRCPSKAVDSGEFNPLPVSVRRTAPFDARTTETELESTLGTQMFAPSKTGYSGWLPTVTVWRTAPEESRFRRV
jgi:hypothetical protein